MMRAVTAVAILFLGATAVEARDRWTGEWGGDCGQDVQCWVTITSASAGYAISWIVADRMDARKILCRIDARTPKASWRLTGVTADGAAMIVTGGGAAIEVGGTGAVDCAGKRRQVPGTYSAFGGRPLMCPRTTPRIRAPRQAPKETTRALAIIARPGSRARYPLP